MPTRFVYLGPEGTFTEQALRTIPEAGHAERVALRGVPEALDAVRSGEADAAVVPVENSVGGAVAVTLDELAAGTPLIITREVVLPVEFVLGARTGTALPDVRTVAAHPQASAQCRGWLRANLPSATVTDVLSNSAAAISAAAGEYDAAVCAPIGAGRYGLDVLAEKIADNPDAVTRFLLVTRPAPPPPPTGDDVTSLAVYIAHDRVGALLAVLTEFAVRGVNLTRIESRPTGEQLGLYVFLFDCTGHVADPRMGEALQGIRRLAAQVRFLGSYPRHRWSPAAGDRPVPAPPGQTDQDFADAAAWLAKVRAGEVA
jgi:prephenate dehydratase